MGRRTETVSKPLPKWVSDFFDRHGNARLRFRRTGFKTYYFKSPFPSKAFWTEYEACISGETAEPVTPGADRLAPGSLAALYSRFVAQPSRLGPSPTTQKKVLAILGAFRDEHGHRMVADVTFEHLDAIFEEKAAKAPWQTQKLRRHLGKMFDFARKLKWIQDNPVDDTTSINAQKRTKSKGYHSWSEAEIRQFVKRHPKGTKAYLALMLLLWSFQRRGDVSALGPVPERPGIMHIDQEKSGGERQLDIPIGKPLQEAIDAYQQPDNWDGKTYLASDRGTAFTKESFGNWFRKRCNEAGLQHCSAHGLRKAGMRRGAELNMSTQSLKAVSGHIKDEEVAYYTRAVEQARLATTVVQALEAADLANRSDEVSHEK